MDVYVRNTPLYARLRISCNVSSISIVKHNTLDELEKIETPLCWEVSSRIANARPSRVFRVGSRTLHVAQPFVWEWLIRGTGKYELKRLTSKGGFAKISRDNRRQWQMQIPRLNPRLYCYYYVRSRNSKGRAYVDALHGQLRIVNPFLSSQPIMNINDGVGSWIRLWCILEKHAGYRRKGFVLK